MNFSGIIIGFFGFLIIGIFHPIIIKCEYYFSDRVWYIFFILGIITLIISFLVENVILSGILGILSFVLFWSIRELKQQTERVKKGWFPKNPSRKYEGD